MVGIDIESIFSITIFHIIILLQLFIFFTITVIKALTIKVSIFIIGIQNI